MDISIVIPAFNESQKIAFDIEMAVAFLESNKFKGEIIVVDDGSTDETCEAAKSVKVPPSVTLKVIHNRQHHGKGYAVRAGVKETSGEYVMFADSGYCVPYGNALLGLEMLKGDLCDIAHGSRKLRESCLRRAQPWRRRISSRAFKWLIKRLVQIPADLTDTQCGFKIYKGDTARELYSQLVSDGFMFDIEIILLAQKQGNRIKEFPIEWTCDLDSRLSLMRTPGLIISELRAIKQALSDNPT